MPAKLCQRFYRHQRRASHRLLSPHKLQVVTKVPPRRKKPCRSRHLIRTILRWRMRKLEEFHSFRVRNLPSRAVFLVQRTGVILLELDLLLPTWRCLARYFCLSVTSASVRRCWAFSLVAIPEEWVHFPICQTGHAHHHQDRPAAAAVAEVMAR